MPRKILFVLIATALFTASLTGLLHYTYPFVLASEEARKSIAVTPEQQAELASATLASDLIAFAIFGGSLCATLALLLGTASQGAAKGIGAAAGLGLGAITGAAAAWLGHWIELNPAFEMSDPMVYIVVRWVLMLAAVGIAAGFAVALASNKLSNIVNIAIGGLLGVAASAITYGLLSGVITTPEGRHKILPFHDTNRVMLFASAFAFVGIGILLQLRTEAAKPKGDTSEAVPTPAAN
ncbi:MAG: hypothetical protein MUD03_06045 [Pirellula sp.]|nr:hypothetical protein [Pirellula sp.]